MLKDLFVHLLHGTINFYVFQAKLHIYNTVYVYVFVNSVSNMLVLFLSYVFIGFTHRSIDWFEHMKYSIDMKNKQL